jgi:formylmethanofuran dehydrogenase subunit D
MEISFNQIRVAIISGNESRRRSGPKFTGPKFTPCSTWPFLANLDEHRPESSHMPETFILIPGRTSKQGCGISEGKFKENYQSEINVLQVNPEDMERLGLKTGGRVRLTSEAGQIEIDVIPSPKDELPAGLLFMAYGDMSSKLMAADTHGTGMPTSKGFDVDLEVVESEE